MPYFFSVSFSFARPHNKLYLVGLIRQQVRPKKVFASFLKKGVNHEFEVYVDIKG
jgi:hypothetical protein